MLPADLALLFRVLLRLQGLGRGVGIEVRVTELLQPYVTSMMADRFNPKRIARNVARSARNWEHLVARLPDDVEAILEQVGRNLGVDFRVRDPDHAVDHLVDGLSPGAAVLAGAQLMYAVPARRSAGSPSRAPRRGCRHRNVAAAHRTPRNDTLVGHTRPRSRRCNALAPAVGP